MKNQRKFIVWLLLDQPRQLVHILYSQFIKPRSSDEDLRRREFILNIILLSSIVLLAWSEVYVLKAGFGGIGHNGRSLEILSGILCACFGLYVLSRSGFVIAAGYALIGICLFCISYAAYYWGVDTPAALLGYSFLIVVATILGGSRFGFIVTFVIVVSILIFGNLEIHAVIFPERFWMWDSLQVWDTIQYAVMLSAIMLVSWLSNEEIHKSLKRARQSEAMLKTERDLLENRVKERTEELRLAQLEKISELSRFAEFGRLSIGLFHDLMNPLTALSLNLQFIKDGRKIELVEANKALDQAVDASRRLENFVSSIRDQVKGENTPQYFSVEREVRQAMQFLDYSARQAGVSMYFYSVNPAEAYGLPLRFRQVVMNLIVNAIESYESYSQSGWRGEKDVRIRLEPDNKYVILTVTDHGTGIDSANLNEIFKPFYTTKSEYGGTGIGY